MKNKNHGICLRWETIREVMYDNWFGVENQYSWNKIQLEKFAYWYETHKLK